MIWQWLPLGILSVGALILALINFIQYQDRVDFGEGVLSQLNAVSDSYCQSKGHAEGSVIDVLTPPPKHTVLQCFDEDGRFAEEIPITN